MGIRALEQYNQFGPSLSSHEYEPICPGDVEFRGSNAALELGGDRPCSVENVGDALRLEAGVFARTLEDAHAVFSFKPGGHF